MVIQYIYSDVNYVQLYVRKMNKHVTEKTPKFNTSEAYIVECCIDNNNDFLW